MLDTWLIVSIWVREGNGPLTALPFLIDVGGSSESYHAAGKHPVDLGKMTVFRELCFDNVG